MEMLRYKEELAEKAGLPSPFGMKLIKEACVDMVQSGMVPSHFANNPMGAYMAAMRGREMGLSPIESIFETFWSAPGGRLGMYSQKMLDLMHRGGVKTQFLKNTAEECEIVFTPPAPHETYTAYFHFSEAQNARLVKDDSNWKKWPADMCKARAISRGWRAMLGTFKGGAALYSKEELEDLPNPEAEKDAQRVAVLEQQTLNAFNPGRKSQKLPTVIDTEPTVSAAAPRAEPPQYGIYRVEGDRLTLISDIEIYGHATPASLRAQALSNQDRIVYAVLEMGTQREIHRTQVTDPRPAAIKKTPAPKVSPILTPSKVLYAALGCKTKGEFETYAAATGLDQLSGSESDAFCLLAAKLLDARLLVSLHDAGWHYADVLAQSQVKMGKTLATATRDEVLTAVNHLAEPAPVTTEVPEGEFPWS